MRHAILLDRAGVDSTTVEINQNALAMCKQVLSGIGVDLRQNYPMMEMFSTLVQGIENRARELDWEGDGTPLGSRSVAKDLYVYGGAQFLLSELLASPEVTEELAKEISSSNMTNATAILPSEVVED